jgi:hypothetical protein
LGEIRKGVFSYIKQLKYEKNCRHTNIVDFA